MDRYEAIAEWLKDYPMIGSWLYFNVTNTDDGNVTLNSVSNSRYITEFLNGSREIELIFAIDMIKPYDTGTSDVNMEALAEVESFQRWCESGTLPELSGCVVDSVEVLETTPSLAIDNDANLCKYQFQCKVHFIEMRGE